MSGRVLLAGVGYPDLRDYSVGPVMIERLAPHHWDGEVVVEDLSFNPIAVVQRLDDDPPERRFSRAIFVAGVSRAPWRQPGSVHSYRWDGILPDAEDIQRAVTEAVTGVILLDNTLVVCRHFAALPGQVIVVEVEPLLHEFGDGFSPEVAQGFETATELVIALAEDPARGDALPLRPLGGGLQTWARVP